MNFAIKWLELEKIQLSEVAPTQKEKHQMFSLMKGFWLNSFRREYASCSDCRNPEK